MHTLRNQLLLELSVYLSNTLQICYKHIEVMHEEIRDAKIIFNKFTGF